MSGETVGAVLLTLLLSFVAGISIWVGISGLRGRDMHVPSMSFWEANPNRDPFGLEEPLRGRVGKWAGVGFVAFGLALLVKIITKWI